MKFICTYLILTIISFSLSAQSSLKLSGTITNEAKEPIESAKIALTRTHIATQSDRNGLFQIELPNSEDIILQH